MLTDTPVSFDRRVQSALGAHGHPPLMVVPRRTPRVWRYASALLALVCLPGLLLRFGRPLARMGARMKAGYGSPMSGLRAFVLLQAASLYFFWSHREALRRQELIYAHDQIAGVVAHLAHRMFGVPYIYDAHEIVPFRARQTGLMRMLLEFGWERAIVGRCRLCHVVNRPMRRFYRHLYGSADFSVRPNDFFPDRALALDPDGPRLIVYVGAVGKHRGLGRMVALAQGSGAGLLCFCSNASPEDAGLPTAEVHGIEGYEALLLRRAAGAAPYLWCGFDTDVLSYRYALPNKFFQAMALGIPIIAVAGSYLGRLATRHGLGIVVGVEADPWSPEVYARCARSMADFRAAYRLGEVSI